NKISSVFYGPILAAFILAILTKKTHALGANIGIVVGVLFNIYLWLYVPQVFWFWWNALGCLMTILVALGVSYAVKRQANKGLEVVYYSGKKEVAILVLYFAAIVTFSLLLPDLLS
ncbi:MAG: sodium transporter, partial [Eudoraea sp.]|nr:sodium transporter [Eudoraea sp.]